MYLYIFKLINIYTYTYISKCGNLYACIHLCIDTFVQAYTYTHRKIHKRACDDLEDDGQEARLD